MLDLVLQIRDASGNEKERMMEAHTELKQIMELAYNPFKKFNVTAPGLIVDNEDGESIFDPAIPDMLDNGCVNLFNGLIDRSISGNEANKRVADYIAVLKKNDAELFQRILDKDLRCGINVKTINKVWPGLIQETESGEAKFAVMNLKGYETKKAKFPVFAGEKEDGDRGRFYKGRLYTRQGKLYKGLGHIEYELNKFTQYAGELFSEFDGELVIPGLPQNESSGLLRNHNETPNAEIRLFDVPSYPGEKSVRYKALIDVMSSFEFEHIKVIPHIHFHNEEDLMSYFNTVVDRGGEGLVVCDPDSQYEDKRSYDWMRLVGLKSADCKVIGFEAGKKGTKLEYSLGKIIVDYKGHKVGAGSGFKENYFHNLSQLAQLRIKITEEEYNDMVRDYIWNNQERFLGMIAKCEFKEETKAGSMRQPIFAGWRYDKTESSFN